MIEVEKYSYNGNESTRIGFGRGLTVAGSNEKVIGLGSDITASVGMHLFKEKFPNRFYSLGIAEQNTIAVAAGMALSGLIPVMSTYAVFSAMRACDQIRVSICYNNLHVLIGGAHAGISVGADGATHQALEDIAIMRALPNMTVLSPCDALQTELITISAIENLTGPVYIRYGREPRPNFTTRFQKLEIGKAQIFKTGNDITIIATGHMVWESLLAAEQLYALNISCDVLNIHTIKPIDKDSIINSAKKTGRVITVEEHQITGGLGGAVAEILSQNHPTLMKIIGINDKFGESGQPDELMEKFGLTSDQIVKAARNMMQK